MTHKLNSWNATVRKRDTCACNIEVANKQVTSFADCSFLTSVFVLFCFDNTNLHLVYFWFVLRWQVLFAECFRPLMLLIQHVEHCLLRI